MPARVHALLVVRPDGRAAPDIRLQRTLTALRDQSRPVDSLTIVLAGADAAVQEIARASSAEGVISADRGTGFAEALTLGSRRLDGDAVWLLTHDTVPATDALAHLAGALEAAPSVAFAAPKLVRFDENDRIVSLGETMTRFGRSVSLAGGELDQGQYDGSEDVLGSDVRGILVRAGAWEALQGLDPALAGADEGLDLGIRARLRGGRITLAPAAVIAASARPRSAVRQAFASRTAQLHRRLAYAPAPAVFLHWLTFLPLAVLRSLGAVVEKHPARILPEWGAAVVAMLRPGAVARSRRRIRAGRVASWSQLAGLRVTRTQLRQRLDDDIPDGEGRGELRFFAGGGAWVVLGALVVSVIAFLSLLAWPVLAGGALAPLRATVAGLWADATGTTRPLGWQTVGPADPFSTVVALLGSLSPAAPSRALVVLWVLALPLATLGGWFAATRFSDRAFVRVFVAVGWALAPSLLDALIHGRPAVVLVHLLLPWLLWSGAAAHRSWTAAGVSALLVAGVLACAPSLAPALVVLWLLALLLTAVVRRGAGLARVAFLIVPAVVAFAPLVWARLQSHSALLLLADPGVPLADPGGTDPARRLLLALGFPAPDGWDAFLPTPVATWTPLLTVPVLLLAVAGLVLARTIPALVLAAAAVAGAATAAWAVVIAVASDAATPITLWPGAALSLYWLAALSLAAVALDALMRRRAGSADRAVAVRLAAVVGTIAMVSLAASAVPALSAPLRGVATVTEGTTSTLPAFVEVAAGPAASTATFVLQPTETGALAVDVVWGDTASLGGQSTLRSARTAPDAADEQTAQLAATLISDPAGPVVTDLAEHGVAFVLLSDAVRTDAARALRLEAETTLNQRSDLEVVGETPKGTLWRVTAPVTERAADTAGEVWRTSGWMAAAVLIALLLAVPTRDSRATARRLPRVIGAGPSASRQGGVA